jgi:hypothetical protein
MEVNREYKSGMFAKLFSDGEALIDLYNAISGSTLPGDTSVDITTLTNVLFNTWRDDVAFLLGDRLVILVEHQSTINYNMPARMFIYAARIYENLIDNLKSRHKIYLLNTKMPTNTVSKP